MSDIPGIEQPYPILLDQLEMSHSVQLFLELCGNKVSYEEMVELIIQDDKFPYKSCIKKLQNIEEPIEISKELQVKLLHELKYSNREKILAQHDMFKQL